MTTRSTHTIDDRPAPSQDRDADLERLRAVAARLDDLFELPLPDAPGFAFVGARFTVETPGSAPRAFSAGAADPDRQRAFRRCVGEAAETMAQFLAGRPPADAPGAVAPAGLADEARLGRLAGAGLAAGWVSATRLADGEPCAVPKALCFRDVEGSVATSLGCAAGHDPDAATRSALFELVERDAVALWWHGGRPARRLQAPDHLLAAMRGEAPPRRTWLLELSREFGVPVVAALSCANDGRDVAAGFAARPTVDAAAAAALAELAQTELGNRIVAMKRARGGAAALAEVERRQAERIDGLAADDPRLVGDGTAAALDEARGPVSTAALVASLASSGIDALRVDLTTPAIGIATVKVIAPCLQGDVDRLATERLCESRKTSGFDANRVSPLAIF